MFPEFLISKSKEFIYHANAPKILYKAKLEPVFHLSSIDQHLLTEIVVKARAELFEHVDSRFINLYGNNKRYILSIQTGKRALFEFDQVLTPVDIIDNFDLVDLRTLKAEIAEWIAA